MLESELAITKKQCFVCLKTKYLRDFTKCKASVNGRAGKCIQCRREYERERYKRKPKMGRRYIKQKKETTVDSINRAIVAKKLALYRKRFQVLCSAGINIDEPFAIYDDNGRLEHAYLIDSILRKHNLLDERRPK